MLEITIRELTAECQETHSREFHPRSRVENILNWSLLKQVFCSINDVSHCLRAEGFALPDANLTRNVTLQDSRKRIVFIRMHYNS